MWVMSNVEAVGGRAIRTLLSSLARAIRHAGRHGVASSWPASAIRRPAGRTSLSRTAGVSPRVRSPGDALG